ncbi:methyltransferase [Candidatus Poribacteria bacterium]|nr:methyltransferase [Candidatus Poribacteria bacterium]
MTSRERVLAALRHKEPDRVPVDLGGMFSTGIMGIAYNRLKSYLGIKGGRTRMYDLMQQLAEPEREILEIIGADVLPVLIDEPKEWKESTLPDGSPCEVPIFFNPEKEPDGSWVLRDDEGRIVSRMPPGGYYFDSVYHPLADLRSVEELKGMDFFSPLSRERLDDLHRRVKELYETTDYALMLNGAGGIYEWAQGLRGWDQFMVDLISDPKFAGALLDELLEANIRRLEQILPVVEGYVQVIQVGDDLGMQDGPQLSPKLYREVVKPRHRELYRYIKDHSSAYLFLHTCGSVYEFIPDFIEMGVDILNPVQVSARDMDTARLKREFGRYITFWGGGCDTQKVLPFGTPEEVREEVRRRISDLAPGGGFVFTQVHNIQADVPPENIMAMYETVREFGRY